MMFSMAYWSAGELLVSCSINYLSIIAIHDSHHNFLQPLFKDSSGIFRRLETQTKKQFLWNCSSLPFAMCISSSKVYKAPEGGPHMLWPLKEQRASVQITFNRYLLYKNSGLEVSQQNRAKMGAGRVEGKEFLS